MYPGDNRKRPSHSRSVEKFIFILRVCLAVLTNFIKKNFMQDSKNLLHQDHKFLETSPDDI